MHFAIDGVREDSELCEIMSDLFSSVMYDEDANSQNIGSFGTAGEKEKLNNNSRDGFDMEDNDDNDEHDIYDRKVVYDSMMLSNEFSESNDKMSI